MAAPPMGSRRAGAQQVGASSGSIGTTCRPGRSNTRVPDELRSPIKHHLLPHRIGTNGHEQAEVFASEIEAGQALEAVAQMK
jgi:hypothetical protein